MQYLFSARKKSIRPWVSQQRINLNFIIMAEYMRVFGRSWKHNLRRANQVIQRDGFSIFTRKVLTALHYYLFGTYGRWIALYDTLDRKTRQCIETDIARMPSGPTISIIMMVSGEDAKWLDGTLRSVRMQLYPRWELCIAVGLSVPEVLLKNLHILALQDSRIRIVRFEDLSTWACKANTALKLASGDFVGPIDPGDTLAEHALYWVAKEVIAYPTADLIFSDEDKIKRKASRWNPWFKSDWNPGLMLSCNAFGRLGIYRLSVVVRLGGFRSGFEGAEEYELVLRCARASAAHRIRHISRILYHRRDEVRSGRKAIDDGDAGRRAIAEHLAIQNIESEVRHGRCGYQVVYAIPAPRPPVSVLIATTARPDLIEPCLKSLFERTSYGKWEVILLVSKSVRQSLERQTLLNDFGKWPNVRIVETPSDRPFNYSWVNNFGATQASGDILCFLNDDTEVITADWLEHLVARLSLPHVAAAGPMLYYPDGTIQHAGIILGLREIAGHAYHREPRGISGYFGRACLEQDVSCVTAACMAIRADVFRTIGGFDEVMPLAYNDIDLCLRLRIAGWRIIWTPAAELIHHESASLGRHNVGVHAEQFARDVALMRQRWQPFLNTDPFYNRNLSLQYAYKLAFPPRLSVVGNQPGCPSENLY